MDKTDKTKAELLAELKLLRKRNAELEKSESRRKWIDKNLSRGFLDLEEIIVVAIDTRQKVTFINKSGCAILGYKKKDLTGKNWFDTVIPENIRNDVKLVFEKLIAGEIALVEYFDNVVLTSKGEAKVIAWHNTILTDKSGKIIGTLSWGEDITERRRTENAREELIQELQNTLMQLRSLKVQMPICSWDKKNLQEAIQRHYENLSREGKCTACMDTLQKLPKT